MQNKELEEEIFIEVVGLVPPSSQKNYIILNKNLIIYCDDINYQFVGLQEH